MVREKELPGKKMSPIYFLISTMPEKTRTHTTFAGRYLGDGARSHEHVSNTKASLRKLPTALLHHSATRSNPQCQGLIKQQCFGWPSVPVMSDPRWNGNGQVFLIGNTLHTMTPYRGEGLDHATIDAVNLGKQLVKAHRDEISSTEAIAASKTKAIPRGERAVKASCDPAYQLLEVFSMADYSNYKVGRLDCMLLSQLPYLQFFLTEIH